MNKDINENNQTSILSMLRIKNENRRNKGNGNQRPTPSNQPRNGSKVNHEIYVKRTKCLI